MTPRLSVIIPTHNRCDQLPNTLTALARQTAAAQTYEVIVIADGCTDASAIIVKAQHLPFTVRVIEQSASGAAAARNRGASLSQAPILLFLDDDMEASPKLIESHLKAHEANPGGVVLGYFRPSELGKTDHLPTVMVNLWWAQRFAEIARPEHRFSCLDLFTGNVSLSREIFESVGRFEEGFYKRAGEDYEIGVRLMKRRVPFRFCREAESIHRDSPATGRSFQRAFAEGRGHALIARKHPELSAVLPLRWAINDKLPLGLTPWLKPGSWGGKIIPHLLRLPLRTAEALKLRRAWRNIQGALHSLAYWNGVVAELGSMEQWECFVQEMPLRAESVAEFEINVETDLPFLSALLKDNPADALRLRFDDTPLGRILPIAGAESLRPAHVHQALVHRFGHNYLTALWKHNKSPIISANAPQLARMLGVLE